MKSPRVVIFCFGGRRPNLELQFPFIHRILDDYPQTEYHLWNLANDPDDAEWIRSTLPTQRFRVVNTLAGSSPWLRFNDVYRYYAQDQYANTHFVKLDDDVVFLETGRFQLLLNAIHNTPSSFVTAKVVNNGACTPTWPGIFSLFRGNRTPLLDVHQDQHYADYSHRYFFDHWAQMTSEAPKLIPTRDWLSINLIGYQWALGRKMTDQLGQPAPREIAGRHFKARDLIGDEGAVNLFPRMICQGFTACHLYFGPQLKQSGEHQFVPYRQRYAEIGRKYLEAP